MIKRCHSLLLYCFIDLAARLEEFQRARATINYVRITARVIDANQPRKARAILPRSPLCACFMLIATFVNRATDRSVCSIFPLPFFLTLTWYYFLRSHLQKKRELLPLWHPRWVIIADTTVTACGHSVLIIHVTRSTENVDINVQMCKRALVQKKNTDRDVACTQSRRAVEPATSEDNLKSARSVHAILTNRARTESTTTIQQWRQRQCTATLRRQPYVHTRYTHNGIHVACDSRIVVSRADDLISRRDMCMRAGSSLWKRDSRHWFRDMVRNMTQHSYGVYLDSGCWHTCVASHSREHSNSIQLLLKSYNIHSDVHLRVKNSLHME